jgi:hypothetical protein
MPYGSALASGFMGVGSGLCGEFMYGEQFLLFWFLRFFKVQGICKLVGGFMGNELSVIVVELKT